MDASEPVAFALGGLAGNNAHGAGFLQGALDRGLSPAMISCTSGQICWVFEYLNALEGPPCEDRLRTILATEIAAVHPSGDINLDCAAVAVAGRPGVFRPAYVEAWYDLMRNGIDVLDASVRNADQVFLWQQWLGLLPARTLVPERPASYFQEVARTFNASNIGILFNSYSPEAGEEFVYLNEAARERLKPRAGAGQDRSNGRRHRYRSRTVYRDIDANAVRSGLWLYAYGFDGKEDRHVDGAYFREIILAELSCAHRIFVVRPISYRWRDTHLPCSYPEMEDLKTEVGFNGSYQGERYAIEVINQLIRNDAFNEMYRQKYHPIHVEEIEIKTQRGYFDYVFESLEVFDEARRRGVERLGTAAYAET